MYLKENMISLNGLNDPERGGLIRRENEASWLDPLYCIVLSSQISSVHRVGFSLSEKSLVWLWWWWWLWGIFWSKIWQDSDLFVIPITLKKYSTCIQ